MFKYVGLSLLLLTTTAFSREASASFVTDNFNITATDFNIIEGATSGVAPIDPVNISFTLVLDQNYVDGSAITSNTTLISANVPYDMQLSGRGYNELSGFFLTLGTYNLINGEPTGLNPGNFDFNIIDAFGANPTLLDVRYILPPYDEAGNFLGYESTNGTVTVSSVSSVPLPATLPLLGVAIAGLGGLARLRKQRSMIKFA